MKKKTIKKNKVEFSEKDRFIYEKGFEDGYATAKRIYRVRHLSIFNENNETITVRL